MDSKGSGAKKDTNVNPLNDPNNELDFVLSNSKDSYKWVPVVKDPEQTYVLSNQPGENKWVTLSENKK